MSMVSLADALRLPRNDGRAERTFVTSAFSARFCSARPSSAQ